MAISGDGNGIPNGNKGVTRVGPLITVQELKDTYLHGLEFKDKNGKELGKESFQTYIDNAVSMLEHYLDISITRQSIIENADYMLNQYADWGYMTVANYPVIEITKLEQVYFRDDTGEPETLQEIPGNWIRIQEHDGIMRLIPNARFPASLQVSQTGNYFPEVMRTEMVPHLWRIHYDYGFKDGCIPVLINEAIARIAAMQSLIIGGALALGAGIAGTSISIDGLSQSVQTTQSAENSAFSAQLKEHQNITYGRTKDDPFAILKILKNFYKGTDMGMI